MLLSVENLSTSFHLHNAIIHAVRSVSFSLHRGESIGIVGESGSGKTVLAHSLLQLIQSPPGKISGKALFDGINLLSCNRATINSIRGNRISMIFQDPFASFNPYFRLSDQLIEALQAHRPCTRKEAFDEAVAALTLTGITNAKERIKLFPHQYSGGMLQRAMIAMSLMMKPEIIIADEPTTALDVTIQAQLLKVLKKRVVENNISVLFITHNLGIVNGFCDRILVVYAGNIVESGSVADCFFNPAHPYTRALLQSVPKRIITTKRLTSIPGIPPDPASALSGCPFYPRCEYHIPLCKESVLQLTAIGNNQLTNCLRCTGGTMPWQN